MAWYRNHYECDRCGACCVHLFATVNVFDMNREPALYHLPLVPVRPEAGGRPYDFVLTDGYSGCPLLQADGLCAIQATKPDACSTFRAGSEKCQWARGTAGLGPLHANYVEEGC